MNKKNTLKLMKDFPLLYGKPNPLYGIKLKFPFSFDVDDGWFDLIYQLSKDIQRVIDNTPDHSLDDFVILQIKEKFGGLRYYVGAYTREIGDLIDEVEKKADHTCEICGKEGKLSSRAGWYKTVCKKCGQKGGFTPCKST